MVSLFIGITDGDWFEYLSGRPELDEANFWQPGGRTAFKALKPGELFLFKLHAPLNFIVGGGIFAHATLLPVSLAWDAFGEANGAASLNEMRERISFYRNVPDDPRVDYQIGCRILEQTFFFPREQWIPVPQTWSPNIVVGKSYDAEESDGLKLWESIQERWSAPPRSVAASGPSKGWPNVEMPRYGAPALIKPRLGQGSFRVMVTDGYDRRCSVTGEKTLPILDAAHIRSFAKGGEHRLDNGLLLRTDIHKLFDLGYVTVTTEGRFEVGRRLKEDFDNGRQYYDLHGQSIRAPAKGAPPPSREALEWHNNCCFLG